MPSEPVKKLGKQVSVSDAGRLIGQEPAPKNVKAPGNTGGTSGNSAKLPSSR